MTIEQEEKRKFIISEIKRLCPNVELDERKYCTDLIYYTPYVTKGKIKVEKNTRGIYLNSDPEKIIKYFYRTEKEAKEAIQNILPEAIEKFNKCKEEYTKLLNELRFSVGYNYDGDSHGIYDEYMYISFKLEEFNFNFVLE